MELIPAKATDAVEAEPKFKEFKDSFNVDLVIRSIVLEDNRRLILLNDIHDRLQDTPTYNKKKELIGYKKERVTVQSEIFLSPSDSERFYSLYKGTTEFTPTENSNIA
jgi:hypothetical protein